MTNNIAEHNALLLSEINQYHAIVKDFSNQSTSIKKLSITIYITFLSAYYGVKDFLHSPIPKEIFLLIGIIIPMFCYIYEIYIDFTRQKLRIKMHNKIHEYKVLNDIQDSEGEGCLIFKMVFIRLIVNKGLHRTTHDFVKKSNKRVFYVDLIHIMYFIYLLEIIIVIIARFK